MQKPLLLFLFVVLGLFNTSAQRVIGDLDLTDSTQVHALVLKDESKLVGRVISMSGAECKFLYNGSVMTVPISQIDFVQAYSKYSRPTPPKKKTPPGMPDLIRSRMLYSPTAFTRKKGDGCVGTIYGAFTYTDYAVSENVSIGAGLFGFFLPGVSIRTGFEVTKKFYLGASAKVTMIPIVTNDMGLTGAGSLQGTATIGTPNAFVNFGGGVGAAFSDGVSEGNAGFVNVGGSMKISEKVNIVTDNMFFFKSNNNFNNTFVPSLAAKIIMKRACFDIGLAGFTVRDVYGSNTYNRYAYFPYLAYTHCFSKAKINE